jgi:hypothetical protein
MNTILALLLGAVSAGPTVTVDRDAVDKGTVTAGPILKHTFTVTNRSSETIHVTALDSPCGCLRRRVSVDSLAPGASAEVVIEVNTLTQPSGPQQWRSTLKLRSGEQTAEVPLSVSATLVRELTVSPPMLSISTDGAATTTVTVTDSRAKPLTGLAVSPSSNLLSCTVTATSAGVWTITVRVSAELKPGTHDETIVLTSDDPAYTELRLPVRVVKRAAAAVTAHPSPLELTGDRGLIQFRRAGNAVLEIANATCDIAGVTVTASGGRGPSAVVKAVVDTTVAKSSGKGTITVTFTEPPTTVTVPVSWLVP